MSVTQRIELVLNLKKISQKEFADMVGVHKNTIQKMIMNDTDPSFRVIQTILNTYTDINYEWLIFGKGEIWTNVPMTKNLVKEEQIPYGLSPTYGLDKKLRDLEHRIANLEEENKHLHMQIEFLNNKLK